MKYIKKAMSLIMFLTCFIALGNVSYARTLEEYDLNSFPVPEGLSAVNEKIDITENAIYSVTKDFANSILSHIDPLSFERDFGNTPPEYEFLQFETQMHPQEIFGFYKDFYGNLAGGKSFSEMHYDVAAGDSVSMCKNNEIVYYTVKIGTNIDSQDLYFAVSAFKVASEEKTEVYLLRYKK